MTQPRSLRDGRHQNRVDNAIGCICIAAVAVMLFASLAIGAGR